MSLPDTFLDKLADFAAPTACVIAIIGSFYLFNALTKAWNSRNSPPVGTLRLNPYPENPAGDKTTLVIYDVYLSKGRVVRGLMPRGVVARNPSETTPGVPNGFFAYSDTAGCPVLVNPATIQAIVPSSTPTEKIVG